MPSFDVNKAIIAPACFTVKFFRQVEQNTELKIYTQFKI